MSSLMFHNGKLLFNRSGTLAMGRACCCTQGCCGCSWLEAYHASGGRIKVSFSGGPLSGYVVLCPDQTFIGFAACVQWRATGCDGAFDNLVDLCGLVPTAVDFLCEQGKSSLNELRFILTSGSAECALTTPVVTQQSCGPPLYIVLEAETFPIAEGMTCSCGDGVTLTIEVENLDPWPA